MNSILYNAYPSTLTVLSSFISYFYYVILGNYSNNLIFLAWSTLYLTSSVNAFSTASISHFLIFYINLLVLHEYFSSSNADNHMLFNLSLVNASILHIHASFIFARNAFSALSIDNPIFFLNYVKYSFIFVFISDFTYYICFMHWDT
jgi:hypothetical protein